MSPRRARTSFHGAARPRCTAPRGPGSGAPAAETVKGRASHGLGRPAVIFLGGERRQRPAGGEAGSASAFVAAGGPGGTGAGGPSSTRHLGPGRAAGPQAVLRRDPGAGRDGGATSDGPGRVARAVAVRERGGGRKRAAAGEALREGCAVPVDLRRRAGELPHALGLPGEAREEARPADDAGARGTDERKVS